MSDYSKIVSKVVKDEIERLSQGNKEQKSRKDRLLAYIDRVMSDPENTNYIKKDCGHYRAAPYKTGQYRIFFELIDETIDFNPAKDKGVKAEGKFVHFVWVNNENCKHDASKGDLDLCYRAFKNMMKNGGLDTFSRPNAPKGFIMGGVLGKSPTLYPKFHDLYGVAQAFANLSLDTAKPGPTEYKLDGLVSKPDSEQREFDLIDNIVSEMNKSGLKIVWEIIKDPIKFPRHQKIAKHIGLNLIESDSVWEVYSNHN